MADDGDGDAKPRNKTRVLVLATRGVVARSRHLMEDIRRLLPHAKREPKLDPRARLTDVNELAELRSCDTVLLFESRKRTDWYLWLARAPTGPSIKFEIQNVHTMDELKFTGNCLAFSRPLVTFDPAFDAAPHWQLVRELLAQTFSSPRGHRKTKPFVDHVISFFLLDDRVWCRHYQVVPDADAPAGKAGALESHLVEIGPRFVLNPVRVFAGSMGGPTLYQNPSYVSPNEIRRAMRKRRGSSYSHRVNAKRRRQDREDAAKPEPDPLRDVFKE